jgi:hypothetical protein
MADIYHMASAATIWLGHEAGWSDEAMDFISGCHAAEFKVGDESIPPSNFLSEPSMCSSGVLNGHDSG